MAYNYPQAPVSTQPDINNAPVFGTSQGARPWSTGIGDCCSDMKICLMGTFCCCCLACKVSSDMGEFTCLPLILPAYQTALRTKLRTQYNIQGSIANDCLMEQCCNVCSLCQLAREVKKIKDDQAVDMAIQRS